MRCGESLVQVDVHHVKSHIARPTGSQHRVEVGTVVVHQAAAIVDEFSDFRNGRLKEPQRVGIGHHHGGDGRTFLCDESPQVFDVNESLVVALHLDDFQSADGGRGRIRAMGRVGDNHLLALQVATGAVIVINNHQSCQFAVSTGIGLEGKVGQSRQCA